MAADDEQRFVSRCLYEPCALLGGERAIHVEVSDPVRDSDLQRGVQHIAGDDGLFPAGADPHAHVPWSVAGRRLERDLLVDLMLHLDEVHEPRLDDWHDALFDVQKIVITLGSVEPHPMLVLDSAKQIAGEKEKKK